MRFSIGKFCLSRDILGHPISVKYNSEYTYNTKIGAFLSIVIQVIVLVQLGQRTIELIGMDDPAVSNQSRPLYREEVEAFGEMVHSEYRFNFGVYFKNIDGEFLEIPEGVGRII